MPAVGFKYPSGMEVSFEACFNGLVDMEKMGCTIATLKYMAEQRPDDRKPSTTELLIGTCEAYLKRKTNYFIDPQARAFALSGTIHHGKLEDMDEEVMSEKALEAHEITGILDMYDPKSKILVDYKNCGSYKIVRALGMDFYLEKDPSGAVYQRSGRWGKKGTPKKVKQFYENEEKADLGDWKWQLNWYRYMLEREGYEVNKIYVQATVRDGGIQMARERGIDKNIYLIKVPMIDNERLREKFIEKRDLLLKALETGELPEKCNEEETWAGVKCEKYCDVRHNCPYLREESE